MPRDASGGTRIPSEALGSALSSWDFLGFFLGFFGMVDGPQSDSVVNAMWNASAETQRNP